MTQQLDSFFNYTGISPEDIPKIPLYMDQLLGLFDDYFREFKRDDNEKIITKTMINNYVKAKVISPPDKKKYSKEHLMLLTLIYKLKNILPINDIKIFFDLYDNDEMTIEERNKKIKEYFSIYNALEMEHLAVLKTKHEAFKATLANEDDKKALIARLLVESDLNKRLALLLMDEANQK